MARSSSEGAALGGIFGAIAAISYSLANLALREVATSGDLAWAIWVSANKALPVSLVAWAIVFWRWRRGMQALPPAALVLPLIATGLVMQFGGNVLFQIALGYGGLALSVPLTFSTIIISGAILGRTFLGEPILPRTAFAMLLMMLAVVVLSQGAEQASTVVTKDTSSTSTILAIVTATGSGIGYGTCGVVIRRCMTAGLSISGTLVVISTTGVVALTGLSLALLGLGGLLETPAGDQHWMRAAGVFNAIAFFAVSAAYQRLSVVKVNLINTSQAAMAGIIGVLMFGEPSTIWLLMGILLTAAGLTVTQNPRSSDTHDEELRPSCPAQEHVLEHVNSHADSHDS